MLIICGKATLTPNDGSAAVTISAGDFVTFRKGIPPCPCLPLLDIHQPWVHYYSQSTNAGFACGWHVLAPMKKHYCYFDEEGNPTKCAGGVRTCVCVCLCVFVCGRFVCVHSRACVPASV